MEIQRPVEIREVVRVATFSLEGFPERLSDHAKLFS
jgi:hypothetical protein